MNISLQNVDKVSALLTVNIEKADYQEKVEKVLKTYRQKANIPGFRKGMVPMSLIKKQFGKAVLAEEVDKLMQEKVNEYIHENKVNMLGMPLPNAEKMQPVDFDTQENFEFVFDIALAPEFNAEITNQDTVDYYTIEVADELVEQQVKMYTQRAGKYDKVEAYEDKDMIKGLLAELDENGNTKEGGIQVEGAVMMPTYMKNDDQKAIFNGAKVNDVLVFNPATAFDNNEAELSSLLKIKKEEVADVKGNFSFQVEEITRMVPAELNQELFDQVFGKDTVKSEEEFRAKIKEGIAVQFEADSNYKFLMDVRDYLTKRVGKLEFPDALLKRIMLLNNEEKGEAFVAENYEKSIEELTWHLIKEQLIAANEIKVEQADVLNMAKEATRLQFAQYGMLNIPEEMLENYAKEMLKKKESVESLVNRAVESKLAAALKAKLEPAFWNNEKQAFVHNCVNGQQSDAVTRYANMFSVFFQYLNADKQQAIKNSVLLNDSILKITTPYMRFYELEALCALGEQDAVMKEMKAYWGGMLKEGATSFWEKYNPEETGTQHLAMYGRPYGKSLCHAWGASPIYLLGKYYLGVKPVKEGYKEFAIAPVLGGLKWMEGTVPTPNGNIHVYMNSKTMKVKATEGKGYLTIKSRRSPKANIGTPEKVSEGVWRLWIDSPEERIVTYHL